MISPGNNPFSPDFSEHRFGIHQTLFQKDRDYSALETGRENVATNSDLLNQSSQTYTFGVFENFALCSLLLLLGELHL